MDPMYLQGLRQVKDLLDEGIFTQEEYDEHKRVLKHQYRTQYTVPRPGLLMIIHAASRDGDTETVSTLLSTAAALSLINTQDASGATLLLLAAMNGHASVTSQLIEARCNINLPNMDGASPLHVAAQYGHASVTKQLIEAPCNVNLQEMHGSTPLHITAECTG
jgi:ankyrin repeat protein